MSGSTVVQRSPRQLVLCGLLSHRESSSVYDFFLLYTVPCRFQWVTDVVFVLWQQWLLYFWQDRVHCHVFVHVCMCVLCWTYLKKILRTDLCKLSRWLSPRSPGQRMFMTFGSVYCFTVLLCVCLFWPRPYRCTIYFMVLCYNTRSSADADNRLDAFSGQSRSTNMVPFHMLHIVSYCAIVTLSLISFLRYSSSKNFMTLKWGSKVTQGHWEWYHSIDCVWFPISVL